MALPNPDMDFTALDILTAAKLDDIVENIEALAAGDGFDAGAIPSSALEGGITTDLIADRAAYTAPTGTVNVNSNAGKVSITGIAEGITIGTPTGTPEDMQTLTMKFKDNGTAQTVTFGTAWVALGVTMPTTTVATKWLYITAMYDAGSSKWHVLSVGKQA